MKLKKVAFLCKTNYNIYYRRFLMYINVFALIVNMIILFVANIAKQFAG